MRASGCQVRTHSQREINEILKTQCEGCDRLMNTPQMDVERSQLMLRKAQVHDWGI